MTILQQPSIFDVADEPRLGALAGRVQRTILTDGAWVDHLPGWLEGSDEVLQTLLTDVPWRAERRTMYDREVDVPRLLCWYSGATPLPHPVLADARAALNDHYRPEPGRTAGHGRTVPVPQRFRQRGLARRHHRSGRAHRHHGGDPVGRLGAGAAAAAARRSVRP